ncbi:DUF4179 domain-containing protein [Fictibacillus phosphorivorans]|uniref:DUF4179 domain-containing protein n=1 Tax=Fictibacillus phosphorivorans TaxID=1221500 RepID=UPI0012930CB0|nr:DUF4179 domain-containing protein [Fictibacillus phosphorivorans]MQR97599.1 DUF4179 domain-containing protein [Fictibacillus phosphorivorans]
MNNQPNDIKHAIEDIHIPLDKLNKTIELGIKRGQVKLPKPKRRLYPIIGVASITTFLLVGSAFVSPAMANVLSTIPGFKSVFEFAGDNGLQIASEKGYSQKIALTESDKDIKLTINDVYYDGTRLSLGYIQESSHSLGELGELELKVNGKRINFGDSRSGEYISDNQYAGVINIYPEDEIPDSFDLEIELNNIGKVAGDWNFKVPIEKSTAQIKTIRVDKTIVYKDTTITVNSLKIGPAGIKISTKLSSKDKENPYLIDGKNYQVNLLNADGMALTQEEVSGGGNDKEIKMNYGYAPLEEETESLTFSPFLISMPNGDPPNTSAPLEKSKLPITLDQGEMGKIIVTDVKHLKDKTLLYFKVDSEFPYDDHMNYNTVWLEDESGTNLTIKKKSYPERIEQNSYVQEFKEVDTNAPLKVLTKKMATLEVVKELELKIPLR